MIRSLVEIRLREREILRLAINPTLRRSVWQVIHGMGGLGKTALALDYASRNAEHYDTVFFARANSTANLYTSFQSIAEQLQLPEQASENKNVTVRAVQRWLNNHSGYLLILDHANLITGFTAIDLKTFLPESPRGHILLTTRMDNLLSLLGIKGNRDYHLYKLGWKDAHDLLIGRAGKEGEVLTPEEYSAAIGLAKDLDYFPLALELAGASIRHGMTFADYRDQLRSRKDSSLADTLSAFATVWQINSEAVRAEFSASAELLDLAAFLSPDDISFELISQAAPQLFDHITDFEERVSYWETLLAPLVRYGLVTQDSTAQTFSLPYLGQAILQNGVAPRDWQKRIAVLVSTGWLSRRYQKEWLDRILDALVAAFPRPDLESQEYAARLIATGQAILQWTTEQGASDIRAAFLLDQAGSCLYARGHYTKAEPMYEKALMIRRDVLSDSHLSTALSLNNLAMLYKSQSRMDRAEPLFLQALTTHRNLLPEKHPDIAISLNNLAALYEVQHRETEAEPLYKEALAIRRAALPEKHPDIALSLNNLAALYRSLNQPAQAEPLFREAVSILLIALGKDHPETRAVLNNWHILQRGSSSLAPPKESAGNR